MLECNCDHRGWIDGREMNWRSPCLLTRLLIGFRVMSLCLRQAPWLACWGDSCRFGTFSCFLLILAGVLIQQRKSGLVPT